MWLLKLKTNYFIIFNFVFACSFILLVPFPYQLLKNIGELFPQQLNVFSNYVTPYIFGNKTSSTSDSDSYGMYSFVLFLCVFSAIVSCILTLYKNNNSAFLNKLKQITVIACSYFIALQLFIYGFDKIFKHQFYLPEPNTLFTPIGYLSKDILYWSTMGSSYFYSVFCGVIEVVVGSLLLFKTTRKIASLLSILVFIHIVAINFGFDISVKIYSCFLLYISFIISIPNIKTILNILVFNKKIAPYITECYYTSKKEKYVYLLIKTLVICLLFGEALFSFIKTNNFNDDVAERPYLHGAYDVKHYVVNGDTVIPNSKDSLFIKRFFVHREQYFITEDLNDTMRDFKLTTDLKKQRLLLQENDIIVADFNYKYDGKTLTLKNENTIITAAKINLNNLPLLKRQFHLTSNEF